jgi:tRNA pseudouridine65 synthase
MLYSLVAVGDHSGAGSVMKIPKIEFQDSTILVVNKPAGFLTHPSELERNAPDLSSWAQKTLAEAWQPVHRLDRATQGLVILTLGTKNTRTLMQAFMHGEVEKHYHALIRGWFVQESGFLGTARPFSKTHFRTIQTFSIPKPVDRYPEARYSEVRLTPHTGRMHQLRRHLASASHPILGDTRYGHGVHNRFAREHLGVQSLCLHATELCFIHPITLKRKRVHSSISHPWHPWRTEL